MNSQDRTQPDDARQERFDDPELDSGVRDTGTDAPEPGSAGRPVGTVDEDANPPMSDPAKSDVYGGTGQLPPQDAGAAIPPYEGRTRTATSGGATTSPADEQPASQTSESSRDES